GRRRRNRLVGAPGDREAGHHRSRSADAARVRAAQLQRDRATATGSGQHCTLATVSRTHGAEGSPPARRDAVRRQEGRKGQKGGRHQATRRRRRNFAMRKLNLSVEPEELMAYLDGELPTERAFDTAAHLEHCGECQKLAAELKEVSQMLVAWEVEEAKEGLPDQIKAQLDGKSENRPRTVITRWPRFRFPTQPEFAWGGGLALILLMILAISIPNLLRSRIPADRAAALARQREEAEYQESRPGLQDGPRSSPFVAPRIAIPSKTQRGQTRPSATPGSSAGSVGKIRSEVVNGKLTGEQNDVDVEEAQESAVDNAGELK